MYSAKKDPDLPRWTKIVPLIGLSLLALYLSRGFFPGAGNGIDSELQQETVDAVSQRVLDLSDEEIRALQDRFGEDLVQIVESSPGADEPAPGQNPAPADTSTTTPVATTPVAPATTTPATGEPEPSETTPAPAPGGVERVDVPLPGPNGTINVDQTALMVARSATVALFTGDFTSVIVDPAAALPTLTRLYPDPLVSEPTVRVIGDAMITFTFTVDPDRDGPAGVRLINTTVAAGASGWSWAGV